MSESGLSSVVLIPERMSRWLKLNEVEPMAQFHRRFWGKSMADEEQEWRNAQPSIPDSAGERRDEGCDEKMYEGDGEVREAVDVGGDEDGDQRMEEDNDEVDKSVGADKDGDAIRDGDVDEIMGEDDDIIPGCYALRINIEGIEQKEIWIRAEYIRVYDYLEMFYDRMVYEKQTPGAVITGQPGIGELLPMSSPKTKFLPFTHREEFVDILCVT